MAKGGGVETWLGLLILGIVVGLWFKAPPWLTDAFGFLFSATLVVLLAAGGTRGRSAAWRASAACISKTIAFKAACHGGFVGLPQIYFLAPGATAPRCGGRGR